MPTPTISVEKAHDVRRLTACAKCGFIGDKQYMPKVDGKHIHGYCALDQIGVDGLLKLPPSEFGKVTLGEIGAEAMKELCDKAARLRRVSPRVAADRQYRRGNL